MFFFRYLLSRDQQLYLDTILLHRFFEFVIKLWLYTLFYMNHHVDCSKSETHYFYPEVFEIRSLRNPYYDVYINTGRVILVY